MNKQLTQTPSKSVLLTTIDNPYNPFLQWDEWNAYDTHKGYNTNSLLARVAITTDELGDTHSEEDISVAVNEIVSENVSGIHTTITADGNSG